MNVTVSVWSRFHAFYLARELDKQGHLRQLITTYPAFEAKKYGINPRKMRSIVWAEVLNRICRRLPAGIQSSIGFPFSLVDLYDRYVSERVLEGTDILVGWSSVAERSFQVAKRKGVVTILERGSTHIETADRLMKEEFTQLEVRTANVIEPRFRDKEKREYAEADFISIPSSHVEQSFLEHGFPKEKLIRVPYGVDLEHFGPGEKRDEVFRVIHCGTLSLRKGLPYLLRAFSELSIPKSELWLIGPMTAEAQPYLKQYAHPGIHVRGTFPEFELHRLYTQGSVYCLMSIEEGMAMTLLQAMACGLPAIVTNFTGGQDIVRDGIDGFVLPPRDVDGLKAKLEHLYKHPEAAKAMGAAAAQNIAGNFTWKHYGERMAAAYHAALVRKHGSKT